MSAMNDMLESEFQLKMEIKSLRETIERQAAQIVLYEQALKASWPEGAKGDAFDYWNKARVKESK